jgi:hypothetical protein
MNDLMVGEIPQARMAVVSSPVQQLGSLQDVVKDGEGSLNDYRILLLPAIVIAGSLGLQSRW